MQIIVNLGGSVRACVIFLASPSLRRLVVCGDAAQGAATFPRASPCLTDGLQGHAHAPVPPVMPSLCMAVHAAMRVTRHFGRSVLRMRGGGG